MGVRPPRKHSIVQWRPLNEHGKRRPVIRTNSGECWPWILVEPPYVFGVSPIRVLPPAPLRRRIRRPVRRSGRNRAIDNANVLCTRAGAKTYAYDSTLALWFASSAVLDHFRPFSCPEFGGTIGQMSSPIRTSGWTALVPLREFRAHLLMISAFLPCPVSGPRRSVPGFVRTVGGDRRIARLSARMCTPECHIAQSVAYSNELAARSAGIAVPRPTSVAFSSVLSARRPRVRASNSDIPVRSRVGHLAAE